MTFSELFSLLDLDKNGELSRSELHESARCLGWHWREAPVLAVLDFLTISKPIRKNDFIAYMNQMLEDPHGPYGKVLLNASHPLITPTSKQSVNAKHTSRQINEQTGGETVALLKHIASVDIANNFYRLIDNLAHRQRNIPIDHAAMLIIDPQRSFTKGVWMKSIGANAEREVRPIKLAFEKCAQLLNDNYPFIETMFTRCPFPPESYPWDDRLTGIIDPNQPYFIKPGNNVLFPPTNGFREWVESFIRNGKTILVIGGCTLNSCVRVSAVETLEYFKDTGLNVVVDLSLSGARTSNFMPSSWSGGSSPVESAVRDMVNAGIKIVRSVEWV